MKSMRKLKVSCTMVLKHLKLPQNVPHRCKRKSRIGVDSAGLQKLSHQILCLPRASVQVRWGSFIFSASAVGSISRNKSKLALHFRLFIGNHLSVKFVKKLIHS